ncbi:MAG: PAS domain S-box protein [Smithellaceae bacterium]
MSKNPQPVMKHPRENGIKKPLKVLVISSSEKEAAAIAAHLEEKSRPPAYKHVADLYELKKALNDKMWDLVICDYSMTGFHAHTAISYLKDCGWNIPLIVVADHVGEEAAAECIRMGAGDFVLKKNLPRLKAVAEREVKQKRAQDILQRNQFSDVDLTVALKQVEDRYRNLIATLQEAYFEVDLEGRYTYVNNAMCDHLGMTREELLGRSYRELQSREDALQTYRVFRQIYKTKKPVKSFVAALRNKGGSQLIYEFAATLNTNSFGLPVGFIGIARDITGQLQAQSALKKSEEMLAVITGNMSDMIRVMDFNGVNIYASPSHKKNLGYLPGERIGQSAIDVVHPDDLEKVIMRFEEGRTTGKQVKVEYRARHSEGHYVWLDTVGDIVWDEQGKPKAVVVISRDISDRKEAEERLRQSEERYRMIVENMRDSIITLDLDFNPIYVSPSETRMTGYTPEEAMKLTPAQAMAPESRELVRKTIEDVFSTKLDQVISDPHYSVNMDLERYHKDGHTLWVEVSASFTRDKNGSPNGIILVCRNITERKTMERALRESENKYRGIFDNAAEGIFQNNLQGEFTIMNHAMVKMLGYDSPEELLSVSPLISDSCVEPSVLRELYRILKKQGHIDNFEMQVYRKNREIIDVSLNAHSVCDDEGKILYFEGILFDITEKRKIDELKMAKMLAERADKAKSEFLANMSHEIRTPMNAIVGFTDLALKQDISTKVRDYLKKISHSAASLLVLIDDILDFSKMEAGQLRFESMEFNLDEIFKKLGDLFSLKSAQKGLELVISIAPDVPRKLIGDPFRLEQVLINILSNAIKFTDTGHIVLRADLLKTTDSTAEVSFSCVDTGIGISRKDMKKIFNTFSQADSLITRKYGGTGLGLTISRHLVGMMDGEITVESEVGRGSTFRFTAKFMLPENFGEEDNLSLPPDLHNLRVLVVDDNKAVRDVLVEQLASFSLPATGVESGEAAINELREAQAPGQRPYELVLMDWLMEGQNGIDTARRIRTDEHIQNKPAIILITAFGREEVLKKAERDKIIDAFIMKPAHEALIINTILEVFGRGTHLTDSVKGAQEEIFGTREVTGLKILLVEDNEINQQLAVEMLKSADCEIDIAVNGEEAVEAVKSSPYDAVLMDVQMPVMSGYEATTLIRADGRFSELPIIAMTAYATSGAKEQCLAAGMNDYISKPIDQERLFTTLARWVQPRGLPVTMPRVQTTRSDAQTVNDYLPAQISGIDIPSGLHRASGNAELYARLLLNFADRFAGAKQEIQAAVEKGEIDEARSLAHTLKGVAGNISATGVQALARDLEAVLEKKKTQAYAKLLAELEPVLDSVIRAIQRGIKKPGMQQCPEAKPADENRIEQTMKQLATLLAKSDPDAQFAMSCLKEAIGEMSFRHELDDLQRYVDDYDFELALDLLDKIARQGGYFPEGIKFDG